MIEIIDKMETSKCACGILDHERTLLSNQGASSFISLDFVMKNIVIIKENNLGCNC